MQATEGEISAVDGRRVAAVVGALIADAAAQPMHWIYNLDVLKSFTDGIEEIEFRDTSVNPFYRLPTGSNTCYGDQCFTMLTSLVNSEGLDISDLKKETYDCFGPNSAYENIENAKYIVGKEDKINIKKTLPITGPWRNGCLKTFIKKMDEGLHDTGDDADDSIDCVLRSIPLVSLFAGHHDMLVQVDKGLIVTQSSEECRATAAAFARILEQYILHGNPEDVLNKVIKDIESKDNSNPHELDKAVVGQIRKVIHIKDMTHAEAVPTHFTNN